MDEAAAQVKMEMTQRPAALDTLDRKLKQAQSEVESLGKKVAAPGGDRTASACLEELKELVGELKEQRDGMAKTWEGEQAVLSAVQRLEGEARMLKMQVG